MEHYHDSSYGCVLNQRRYKKLGRQSGISYFTGKYCKIHKKNCCRCGWEWGWHCGNKSDKTKYERFY